MRKIIKVFLNQKGMVNIGGVMMLGISMVFLAVGFIFLPISTNAVSNLLDYSYSSYTAITDATYTGYTSVLGITPLLILIGFLTASVISGMLGIMMKGNSGAKADPGSLIMLGLTIVFVAIGLIVQPVMLDAVSANVASKDLATNSANVTTAPAVTTGSMTLTYDLWNNLTTEISSLTSSISETPVASSYNPTTNALSLSSLTANTTRTITAVYNHAGLIDGTSDFTGYHSILLVTPMLVHLGFLVAAVLVGFFGIKRLSSMNA